MNLYKYHSNPEQLDGYKKRAFRVPELAYDLAKEKGKRVPEAEPAIMQDPSWAYRYALGVIGDRWPEAEPVIKQDPEMAYWHARFVIGDRWPEAEPVIMKQPSRWRRYKEYFNL